MSKIAFVFPGQGSQYVGMGKGFYDNVAVSKEIYDIASEASGMDIPALCFTENEELNITKYTQVAMLATEVALLKAVEEKGFTPAVCGGLSLGEYGALVASGVMSPADAFKVVVKRGLYMQEAVPTGGAMAAVLGLDASVIEETIAKVEGIVSIANYNCPGQIVITGEKAAVEKAGELLTEAGAKRVVMLNVSGPFHSKMLTGAGEKLGEVLDTVTIGDVKIPYIANLTADYVTGDSDIKDLLVQQVSSSVRWEQSVRLMMKDGVDTFVEIGPGKTINGFIKKITRETGDTVNVINVDNYDEFEAAMEKLKELA